MTVQRPGGLGGANTVVTAVSALPNAACSVQTPGALR